MDIRSLDLSQLTRQEQLDLIERLWDAIDAATDEPPPGHGRWPQEPKAFLDALVAEAEAARRDPASSLPWEEVFEELLTRRKA